MMRGLGHTLTKTKCLQSLRGANGGQSLTKTPPSPHQAWNLASLDLPKPYGESPWKVLPYMATSFSPGALPSARAPFSFCWRATCPNAEGETETKQTAGIPQPLKAGLPRTPASNASDQRS